MAFCYGRPVYGKGGGCVRGSGGADAGHGVVGAELGGGAEEFAEARHHFLRLLEGVEVYVGYGEVAGGSVAQMVVYAVALS